MVSSIGGINRLCFLAAISVLLLASCRPSQQTRRSDIRANKNATSTSGKSVDSLLLVQNHLIDLIDTMSSALEHDRSRIKSLEIEVAHLRSMVEQQRMQPARSMLPSMNPPPTQVPQPPPVQTERSYIAPPPSGGIPQGSQLPSSGSNGPFIERYSRALQLFNEARYEEAMNQFDDLSKADPSSSYTPNYLYWRGESQYALSHYSDAVNSFRSVMDGYPSSNKADDAAFKIGESYEKMGDKTSAKNAYQHLLASYPDSEYRNRVEARLKKLQ